MITQHSEHPNGLTGMNASQIEQVLRQPFLDDWIAGIVVDEQAEGPSQRFYTSEPLPSVSVENYTSKIASDADGYGNAIVPALAAEFIMAAMEATE